MNVITPDQFARITGKHLTEFAQQCGAACVALIESGQMPEHARIARGFTSGLHIRGQHSWIVLGDPYDTTATVIDATAWSYAPWDAEPHVRVLRPRPDTYVPHGSGPWINSLPPVSDHGEEIMPDDLSDEALAFLDSLRSTIGGPIDVRAWMGILSMNVGGWPAAEITGAAYLHPRLSALTKIDHVGMLTDLNPGGAYPRPKVAP